MGYSEKTSADHPKSELVPPQSLEAEQSVLGSILKDSEAVDEAVSILGEDPHVFYSPIHQRIYGACMSLRRASQPIDITTVSNEIDTTRGKALDEIGGRVYLVDLVEGVISTANIEHHARIVYDKFLLRRMIQSAQEIVRSAYAMEEPVEDLLDFWDHCTMELRGKQRIERAKSVGELMAETDREIDDYAEGRMVKYRIPTGFFQMDHLIFGLPKATQVIVAGDTSGGKTQLALQIGENIASAGAGVLYNTTEMKDRELNLRALCTIAGFPMSAIIRREVSKEQLHLLQEAKKILKAMPFFIYEAYSLTPNKLRQVVRRAVRDDGVQVVVVDYLQFMRGDRKFYKSRHLEVEEVSRNLLEMAKEFDVALMTLSQVSRPEAKTKAYRRHRLSDLKESGSIENDAHIVMFVEHPKDGSEIVVEKHRNGPRGSFKCDFKDGRWALDSQYEIPQQESMAL